MTNSAVYCSQCGAKQEAEAVFCSACGNRVAPDDRNFLQRHKRKIIGFGIFLLFWILLFRGIGSFFASMGEVLQAQEYESRVIMGTGERLFALISIDGVILETTSGGGLASFDEATSARTFRKTLNEIQADEAVAGLIVRVNSPGGSAAAAEEMYQALLDFKAATGMPVLFYFSDTAASGGYYVAMAADEIIANPNTITGSIGVIISSLNISSLAERYGISNIVFQSGENKDLLNPLSPEPTAEERAIIQGIIDDVFERFLTVVSAGREMDEATVLPLADGRIFSAKSALEHNLVDSVGTFADTYTRLLELTQLEEATVLEYGRVGFFEQLLGSSLQRFQVSFLPGLESSSLHKTTGTRVWLLMQ